jgi:thiol-disulfide isomerase/thioredoxin
MRLMLIGLAFLAVSACNKPPQQQTNEPAPTAEGGPQKGVDRSHRGEAIPDARILDAEGKDTNALSLTRRRPLLLNLWATWCAPCVKELPTLQTLRDQSHGSIIVQPVSQDDGPHESVKAFLVGRDLYFAPYQDPRMALSAALGPDTVLPTTILYDADGKEVWRYVGDLDWTSPEAATLLAEAGPASKKG